MKKIISILAFIVVLVGLTGGAFYWYSANSYIPPAPRYPNEALAFEAAKKFFTESNSQEALSVIREYEKVMFGNTEASKRWLDLFIDVSTKEKSYQQLVSLYDFNPGIMNGHEEASVLVAKALLATKRVEDYSSLRQYWQESTAYEKEWFLLDADKLLVIDKRDDAVNLLNSRTLDGALEIDRLIKLALVSMQTDPKASWEYLQQALNKDPTNYVVRSLRAGMLEALKKDELALSEYLAVIFQHPERPELVDQLAEFYRRHHQCRTAIELWCGKLAIGLTSSSIEAEEVGGPGETGKLDVKVDDLKPIAGKLKAPTIDYIWLKAWFWSKVISPVKVEWAKEERPEGKLRPLLDFLAELPAGQYWDESKIKNDRKLNQYLNSTQSTFWLRLIALLKDENEKDALVLTKVNPFKQQSWDSDLEIAIRRILSYRQTGNFGPEENYSVAADRHPFFATLDEAVKANDPNQPRMILSDDLRALLDSKEVFAAVFMAAGWMEASLQVHRLLIIPEEFPAWISFGMTQTICCNRGNTEALDFASKQKNTPDLAVLIGELMLCSGSMEAGIEQLKIYAKEDSNVGQRSAWLMAQAYIQMKKFDEARVVINEHPKLSQEIVGKELIARTALIEGNGDLADRLYAEIEAKSSEAKSYMARKAYMQKDLKRARELTEELLREHPCDMVLRYNIVKISQEEQGKAKP